MFKTLTAFLFWMVAALYLGHVFTDVLLKFFIPASWAGPLALVSAGVFYGAMRWLRSDASLHQASRINVSAVAHFAPAPGGPVMWETQSPFAALFHARAFIELADRFTAWWLQQKARQKNIDGAPARAAAKPQPCAGRKPACHRPHAAGPRL